MLPRKKLDIGWADLGYAALACFFAKDGNATRHRLATLWSPDGNALTALSVRSGFDAVLQCLAFPPGSEILVSAVTIRDMVSIVEKHGLVAIPVDIDPDTCAVRPERVERLVTSRSRAILVAHLFGARMDMTGIAATARLHRLYLLEDCAQAYAADGYRGHPHSDVAMFSFGPIKTATALGGALLSFRDRSLRDAVESLQSRYPTQSRRRFLRTVVKFGLLKALSQRMPYSAFVVLCRLFQTTHDRVIGAAARGFAGGDLTTNIRYRPSGPLIALLERRIRGYGPGLLEARVAAANFLSSLLTGVRVVSRRAEHHTHWVFPILSAQPDRLVASLWKRGFDATRGASSLYAVPAPSGRAAAPEARRTMDRIVYLPVDSGARPRDLQRLAEAVVRVEIGGDPSDRNAHGRGGRANGLPI